MRPTLRQIEYFVAVADHGAFGMAAAALHVSQPSLSKQLATMEAEIGGTLFERTSRRVTLTALGRTLLPRARRVLQDVRELKSVARGPMGLFGDRLSMGVLPSIGAYFMPVATRHLHHAYPSLRLMIEEGATRELLQRLEDGLIDAVIGTPSNDPDFISIPLFSEALWICVATDHPLYRDSHPVTLADLAGQPLLSLSHAFTLAEIVDRLANEARAYVSRDYQGGSLDAVRQMAVMGAGIGVLPSLYALAEAIRDPEFRVRRIDHPLATHPICLHHRRTSAMAEDYQRLAEILIKAKQEIRLKRDVRFQ